MGSDIERPFKSRQLSRRTFLSSMGALAVAGYGTSGRISKFASAAEAPLPPISVQSINHMTLSVSDPAASLEWYQGLFGMPIAARQGGTIVLQVGDGPQFIALGGNPGDNPRITHYCLAVDNFDHERIVQILAENGVAAAGQVTAGAPGGLHTRIGNITAVRVIARVHEAHGLTVFKRFVAAGGGAVAASADGLDSAAPLDEARHAMRSRTG